MTQEFRREKRYIVLKISDLLSAKQADAISDPELYALKRVCLAVGFHRQLLGKPELSGVMVECDWPEHDLVWNLIEQRMANSKSLTERSQEALDRWWDENEVTAISLARRVDEYRMAKLVWDAAVAATLSGFKP